MSQDSHEPIAARVFSPWKWIAWTVAILVGLWVAITAVDRHQMEKLRTEVESRGGRLEGQEFPPAWYHWLETKAPTDWLRQAVLRLKGNFRRVVSVHVPPGSLLPSQFFSRLSRFQKINWIELPSCQLSDQDFEGLTKFTELGYLDLRGNPVTDKGLAQLSELSSLQVLLLDETHAGDQVLQQAFNMPKLTTLLMSKTKVTDAGLKELGSHAAAARPTLKVLFLNGTQISDEGLNSLLTQPSLTHFSLSGCEITDRGLGAIDDVRFPLLTALDVGETKVTGDGISKLRLDHLQSLSFPDVAMTDEHWRGLTGLKKLDYVTWGDVSLRRVEVFHATGKRTRLDTFKATGVRSGARCKGPFLSFGRCFPELPATAVP